MAKPKLLLADDSVTIRKVVELTFADEGIDVAAVGDAIGAMQRFVEMQPDIVLVDIGLDGTNGYQICEMIKADEATRHIPVMLLVGSFEPFDHDEANRVGADGFLTKPFNSIRDLVGRVKMLLGSQLERAPALSISEPSDNFASPALPADVGEFMPAHSIDETNDIDLLYKTSLAETDNVEDSVENFDAVDDPLGDPGLDDELIEASYLEPPASDRIVPQSGLLVERTVPVKEFDWSLESLISAPASETKADDESGDVDRKPEVSEDNHLGNGSDEVAPTDSDKLMSPRIEELDTIEISVRDVAAESEDSETEPSELIEFLGNDDDWIGDRWIESQGVEDSDDVLSFGSSKQAIHVTIPSKTGEQPPFSLAGNVEPEASDMIEKITNRVIERLSDTVIREIAKVEVPRIAEKLIREALEQEKKD